MPPRMGIRPAEAIDEQCWNLALARSGSLCSWPKQLTTTVLYNRTRGETKYADDGATQGGEWALATEALALQMHGLAITRLATWWSGVAGGVTTCYSSSDAPCRRKQGRIERDTAPTYRLLEGRLEAHPAHCAFATRIRMTARKPGAVSIMAGPSPSPSSRLRRWIARRARTSLRTQSSFHGAEPSGSPGRERFICGPGQAGNGVPRRGSNLYLHLISISLLHRDSNHMVLDRQPRVDDWHDGG